MATFINEPTPEELTEKGFTNRIQIDKEQTKERLLSYGFTNYDEPSLYYMEMLDKNTSFNLSLDAKTLEVTGIDILNEDFLQPYDYQAEILSGNISGKARNIYNKVNNSLTKLQNDGIIAGFEKGMYI